MTPNAKKTDAVALRAGGADMHELTELLQGLDPGPEFPSYRVVRSVARGGMAQLLEAWHRDTGRHTAIKVLHPHLAKDERCRRLMLREAHALVVASHPLVVELHEYGDTAQGCPFLALEWLDGQSLHTLVDQGGPVPLPRALAIFGQVTVALEVVHGRGLVHADLKPENVMILRDEEVKLLDFGVASIQGSACARSGEVCGTIGYLAPELMRGGRPSRRSDVYSAGILLFEMLSGLACFPAHSLSGALELQCEGPPPSLAAHRLGSPLVDKVIARALAPYPEDRYESLADLHKALVEAVAAMQGRRHRSAAALAVTQPSIPLAWRVAVPVDVAA